MTTKHSPLRVLTAQATKIAMVLKAAERGENIEVSDPVGKIAAARGRDSVTFGVVMDDKVLKIEMAWTTIRSTTAAGIIEYIMRQMREARDVTN